MRQLLKQCLVRELVKYTELNLPQNHQPQPTSLETELPSKEFAFLRISTLFTPWFSSAQHSGAVAREHGRRPQVTPRGCQGSCGEGKAGGPSCSALTHIQGCPTHHPWREKRGLHSLEMQKYLFWFPSLFLEIMFWFIKHRNSQHLKQTFKTPKWQIIDFFCN